MTGCTHDRQACGRLHLAGGVLLVLLVCDRCQMILLRYPSLPYTTNAVGLDR